jgi:hypothetical protein
VPDCLLQQQTLACTATLDARPARCLWSLFRLADAAPSVLCPCKALGLCYRFAVCTLLLPLLRGCGACSQLAAHALATCAQAFAANTATRCCQRSALLHGCDCTTTQCAMQTLSTSSGCSEVDCAGKLQSLSAHLDGPAPQFCVIQHDRIVNCISLHELHICEALQNSAAQHSTTCHAG